jgi:hypothetical protein
VIWLALLFLVVAILGSIAYAALRAWRLFKTFRSTMSRAGDALGGVTDKATEAERHASALSTNAERLTHALDRLQEALAELAILRTAYGEARSAFASVRGFAPRK